MLAAKVGAQLTAFVTNRATALVLSNLKEATGSGKPLLQPDPPHGLRGAAADLSRGPGRDGVGPAR
jgi:hypothetical protein